MTPEREPLPSTAEARLELLTRVNRAVAGAEAPSLPAYPLSAPLTRADVLHQFEDRILDYKAAFTRVPAAEAARAVTAALGDARRVVVPAGLPSPWLSVGVDILRDEPPLSHAELDRAGAVLTGCAAAISETGTIILDHGPGQGRRALSLIPDLHVCVVRASQVVQHVRAGVEAVAPSVRAGRPLTWLSGGSATSDIELVRVEGVHGPRRLHVVLLEENQP
ncbi:L-lactate dehydrogenase complex protein LldG [Deinococcus reticulitermitis]|uniref:L-lactate dehydrogenase complex protein LldG n=1 Tax=Deinococcus reticulitermitis TaxID=856736 RepID=A0A1H6RTS3_9DEIO|nr:lactate utilization protein C [Deinococcus reticulitermitis]SEI59151.1 L-lactate dehydrogenase complex protein LldG [Deinococcus reticulitermitis]